jgi:membrane-bound lytic murein transglycosylase B
VGHAVNTLRALIVAIGIASIGGVALGAGSSQSTAPIAPVAPLPPPPFDVWLAELRAEASARGISEAVLEEALGGLEPAPQILERDRTQAEFVLDVEAYLKRRLTRPTVRTAQREYSHHRTLLARVAKRYGVPSRILVSVWGLESNFGRFAGVRPTIQTLATLAYDQRRGVMFRNELLSALQIVERGDIDVPRLKGSWAGALGQPQFMPSSYLEYAQDFDGDGKRDIWSSPPDVFASIAFYLRQHGWDGTSWGREVRIPAAARAKVEAVPLRVEGCRAERDMSDPKPLSEWRRLGLRTPGGTALPVAATPASLVKAGRRNFLVYANYEALLGYNCAHTYALSVALLSDRLK